MVLPQALRIAVGPTIGFLVQIIKGTSLAYIIGFQDVMSMGKRWANAPVDGTEPFIRQRGRSCRQEGRPDGRHARGSGDHGFRA